MRRLLTVRADVLNAAADLEALAAHHESRAASARIDQEWTEMREHTREAHRLRAAAGGLSQVGYGL